MMFAAVGSACSIVRRGSDEQVLDRASVDTAYFKDSLNFECTCDEDADCPSPDQVCAQGGCVEACSVDADCPDGAFCDPGLRQCAFGCLDDVLEPNNGFGQTVPLEPGVNQDLRMCYDAQEGGLPEEAQDCFDFFIDAPSQVTVAVTFSHEEGDLNAVMVNPSFVELGRAESLDDNE